MLTRSISLTLKSWYFSIQGTRWCVASFTIFYSKKNLAPTRYRIGVGRHPSKRYSYLAGFNWVCILLEARCVASYFELLLPTSHPDISLTLPSQRFLSPVHDWQLSFLVECLTWTWKFIVALREEMSSCGWWARDSHHCLLFPQNESYLLEKSE